MWSNSKKRGGDTLPLQKKFTRYNLEAFWHQLIGDIGMESLSDFIDAGFVSGYFFRIIRNKYLLDWVKAAF